MIFDYFHEYPVGYRVDYVSRNGDLKFKKYSYRRDLAERFAVKCHLNGCPARLVSVMNTGREELFAFSYDLLSKFGLSAV